MNENISITKKQAEALGNLGMMLTDNQILEQHYDGWEGEYECLNALTIGEMKQIVSEGYTIK